MNKPISGSTFRKLGIPREEFKVYAQNNPNMTVRVNEGSYFTTRMKLVEFDGGNSPIIHAPSVGYKWVVISINPQGTLSVSSGEIKNKAPELPAIEKNFLPLAAIYLGANSTAITQDMIEDIRPFLSSGYYPGDHTILDNCDQPNLHPITSITGLNQVLDNKANSDDLERFNEKIDEISGTSSAMFTLNNAQTGISTVSSGIMVERGSENNVGIRFNIKRNNNEGAWEFTNDGSVWHEIPTTLSIDGSLKKASTSNDGVVKLSVEPDDAFAPIAVGTNDPRLAKIDEKANKIDVYTKEEVNVKLDNIVKKDEIYTRTNIDDMLDGKADVDTLYTKPQMDAMLRGKINVGDAYIKAETDNLLITKANIDDVYNKTEIDNQINTKADASIVYTKDEIDAIANEKANVVDVYNKTEIDDTISNITNTISDNKNVLDDYITSNNTVVDTKADKDNTYTKDEVDTTINNINTKVDEVTNSLNAYITSNDELVNAKANVSDVYTKHEVDDVANNKVDKSDFDALEQNVTNLSTSFNTTLTDVAASIVTQTEYQKDFRATQDIFGKFQNDLTDNKDSVVALESTVNDKLDTKADKENTYTKDEVINLLAEKANFNDVYQKIDTYSSTKIQELLDLEANKDSVYTIAQVDDLLATKTDNTVFNVVNNDLQTAKSNIENINNVLNTKSNKEEVYTKDEIDASMNTKANQNEFAIIQELANNNKTAIENISNVIGNDESYTGVYVRNFNTLKANQNALDAAVKSNADAIVANHNSIEELKTNKADANKVYTKEEVDTLLANMYTKEQVNTAIENAIADALQQIRDEINS